MQITLNEETLEKLKSAVNFENDGAVYAFLADAINTYVELGQLSNGGFTLYAAHEDDGEEDELRRVYLPFQIGEDGKVIRDGT